MNKKKKSVLDLLRSEAEGMTKKQLVLSGYLLSEYNKAAFMNSKELALRANVSESTVLRLASRLGYEKFCDFQDALQEIVRYRISSLDRFESSESETDDILSRVVSLETALTNEMLQSIKRRDFEEAVNLLYERKNVILLGFNSERNIVEYTESIFQLIRPNIFKVASGTDIVLTAAMKSEGDKVALVYSFPRYYRKVADITKYLCDQGVPVIGVTDNVLAPIASCSSPLLLVPMRYLSFIDPHAPVMALTHALAYGVVKKDPARAREQLQCFYDVSRSLDSCVREDIEVPLDI